MAEYIVQIEESEKNMDEHFVGALRLYPELVRCKDCKHWRANTQFCSVFSSLNIAHRMPPDGYCSEAERKEE